MTALFIIIIMFDFTRRETDREREADKASSLMQSLWRAAGGGEQWVFF